MELDQRGGLGDPFFHARSRGAGDGDGDASPVGMGVFLDQRLAGLGRQLPVDEAGVLPADIIAQAVEIIPDAALRPGHAFFAGQRRGRPSENFGERREGQDDRAGKAASGADEAEGEGRLDGQIVHAVLSPPGQPVGRFRGRRSSPADVADEMPFPGDEEGERIDGPPPARTERDLHAERRILEHLVGKIQLGFDPREGPPIDDDRSRPKRGQGSGHQIEQIVAADQGPEESQGVGGEDRGTQTGHAHGRERQRGTATRCRISSMRASDSWMRTSP